MSSKAAPLGLKDGLVRAFQAYCKLKKIEERPQYHPLFALAEQTEESASHLHGFEEFLKKNRGAYGYPLELTAEDFCRVHTNGHSAFSEGGHYTNSHQKIIISFLKHTDKKLKAEWLFIKNGENATPIGVLVSRDRDNLKNVLVHRLWGVDPYGLGQLVKLTALAPGFLTDNDANYVKHYANDLTLDIVRTLYKDSASLHNLSDIDDVRGKFEPTDVGALERMARDEARHEPIKLIHFGKSALDILPEIALATLRTAAEVSLNLTDFSSDALAAYYAQVKDANRLVSEALGSSDRTRWSIGSFFSSGSTKIEKTKYVALLEEAQKTMKEAGETLSVVTTPLAERESRLEQAMRQTQKIVDFYQVVAKEIADITRAGEGILLDWKKEAAHATASINTQHITILETRLQLLGRSGIQINASIARASMQAEMDMQQWQSLHATKVDTIPSMVHDHASQLALIGSLLRSELIDACVDASGQIDTSRIAIRDEVLKGIARTSEAIAIRARQSITSTIASAGSHSANTASPT